MRKCSATVCQHKLELLLLLLLLQRSLLLHLMELVLEGMVQRWPTARPVRLGSGGGGRRPMRPVLYTSVQEFGLDFCLLNAYPLGKSCHRGQELWARDARVHERVCIELQLCMGLGTHG